MELSYRKTVQGEAVDVTEPIQLETTAPHFGGIRNWFICPLVKNAQICNRRAQKLYLPNGAKYFGCRVCYDLTYESCRTHDWRVSKLRRNPFALAGALRSKNVTRVLLGLRTMWG
jgi:hypothetical protein